MRSLVILLTGTIKVSNVPNLLMTDTTLRENEYFKSIKKWISLGYPVVFCENSNYESGKINKLISELGAEQFEYLKFHTTQSYLGKGNGEAEVIDYAFTNSRLISKYSFICKATGKNYIENATQIISKILEPSFNKDMVIAILRRKLTFADSRFFFFEKEFYNKYWKLSIKGVDENNGIFLEHTLARAIRQAIATGESWKMLPLLPIYDGYYGTNGTLYKNSMIRKLVKRILYSIKKNSMAIKI